MSIRRRMIGAEIVARRSRIATRCRTRALRRQASDRWPASRVPPVGRCRRGGPGGRRRARPASRLGRGACRRPRRRALGRRAAREAPRSTAPPRRRGRRTGDPARATATWNGGPRRRSAWPRRRPRPPTPASPARTARGASRSARDRGPAGGRRYVRRNGRARRPRALAAESATRLRDALSAGESAVRGAAEAAPRTPRRGAGRAPFHSSSVTRGAWR